MSGWRPEKRERGVGGCVCVCVETGWRWWWCCFHSRHPVTAVESLTDFSDICVFVCTCRRSRESVGEDVERWRVST